VHTPDPRRDGHPAGGFEIADDEVTCQQFVELVTELFEGVLPPHRLGQVEEHLVMCDWCVTYLEQMQATVNLLHTLVDPSPPEPPAMMLVALRAKRAAGR
jgi:predicted anti-sigma-YlaC factor YlaD